MKRLSLSLFNGAKVNHSLPLPRAVLPLTSCALWPRRLNSSAGSPNPQAPGGAAIDETLLREQQRLEEELTEVARRHGAAQAPARAEAEDEEEAKDQRAAKLLLFCVAAFISGAVTLYFGLPYARRKYLGASTSARVSVETRGRPSLGGPFTLVTTDGEPVSQAAFLGKWTFFYFGFVHCPEICPIELNRMSKVIDGVAKARPQTPLVPLFVSCDPKRDSLLAIKEYLSIFHKDFIGLVGTPKQVNDACKSYRIYYSLPDDIAEESGDYLIDHSIAIFLFDPQGRFVDFFGNRYSEEEIEEKVISYIDKYNADPNWTNY